MNILEIQDLAFRYPGGGFSLRIGALAVAPGEAVAITGPSGCGKTTLLELAAGVRTPDSGTVTIDGRTLSEWPEDRRAAFRLEHIGLVFQEFELVDHLSVRDNLLLPVHLGLKNREIRNRAERAAADTGIAGQLDKPPRELSQGERQRVAICRALAIGPRLILADEPTGNLDPPNKRAVLDLLVGQAKSRGSGVLVATHDHGLLDAFDRVIDFETLNSREPA